MLSAYDVKDMAKMHDMQFSIHVSVFSFSSSREGNQIYSQRMEEIVVKIMSMVNMHDVVPNVPRIVMNENMGWMRKLLNSLPWT